MTNKRENETDEELLRRADLNQPEQFTWLPAEEGFKKTGNPLYAIWAVILASKLSSPVPDWALKFISVHFEEFFKNKGAKSLDKTFFRITNGRGLTKKYNRLLLDMRDYLLSSDVAVFMETFELSDIGASALVAECCGSNPEWSHGWLKELSQKEKEITTNYLKNIYYRWKAILHDVENRSKFLKDEEKSEHLKRYLGDNLYNNFPPDILDPISLSKLKKYGLKIKGEKK